MTIPHPSRIWPSDNDISEDALLIEIGVARVQEFLRRPDADAILEQNPEVTRHYSDFVEALQAVEESLRFITAGRAAPKYGITQDQFWGLVQDQNWSCPICGRGFVPPGAPRMNIDHNHATEEVRGVLCTACNTTRTA